MRRRAPAALTAAALALGGSGCGGSSHGAGASTGRTGRQVFAASCAACHGLTGRESPGLQGGDLAAFRMTEAQIESETRVMPVRRPLSAAQVRAVSAYVLAVQRAFARR